MTSSDYWDDETAERYDESSAFMFTPEVLEPAVDFLAELCLVPTNVAKETPSLRKRPW